MKTTICGALALALGSGCGHAACPTLHVHDAAALRAAAACESVDGDLAIEGTGIDDLSALRGLRRVSGTVTIAGAPRLASLDGLEGLRSAGYVVIAADPSLRSIDGLRGLRETRGLSLIELPALERADGPGALRSLDGLVIVSTGIRDLEPLARLSSLGDLVATDDPALESVARLDRVARAADLERLPVLASGVASSR
jgi:hypothetical protein